MFVIFVKNRHKKTDFFVDSIPLSTYCFLPMSYNLLQGMDGGVGIASVAERYYTNQTKISLICEMIETWFASSSHYRIKCTPSGLQCRIDLSTVRYVCRNAHVLVSKRFNTHPLP